MCGRFTLTVDPAELQDTFSNYIFPPKFAPRFNIAPTQEHWVVTARGEDRAVRRATWGLVTDASRIRDAARFINARSEDVQQRPTYRGPQSALGGSRT